MRDLLSIVPLAAGWEAPLFVGLPALIVLSLILFLIKRYRRCPSNRVLVVYGKVGGNRAAKCIHGGGVMVWPVLQDYVYMSLEPMTLEIDLTSALSKQNIRVNVPSTFTIGISTQPEIMQNAAERLLGLAEKEIASQARDIILGQLRLVIATLTIEEINQDREKFLDLVTANVGFELNKIGLLVINVNIRDITDESGYIEAIGKKAAADAINRARVEVAEAEKMGAIGEASNLRVREVEVANQHAHAATGKKEAERSRRVAVAKLEAEGVSGEAIAEREQQIAVAEQAARTAEGRKSAEAEQRVKIAEFEAGAVAGENRAKAEIADYEATLAERRAEAKRRGEVALANASRDVLVAEREREQAKLEKEQIVQELINRQKVEIDAEAEAERIRRLARGEADGILARYRAEAEGVQAVLLAKASGYESLLRVCGERKDLAPTLLMVEKMPELVAEQVKAIQNLKIDKITVWDSGNGENGSRSTAGFLSSLIGSLPPVHELAEQAGVELPGILGSLARTDGARTKPPAKPPKATEQAAG
jgi:flotillin